MKICTKNKTAQQPNTSLSETCIFLFVGFYGYTSHQHYKGYMATFKLYLWRKTSGVPLCIISGTSGHLSRTTRCSVSSLNSEYLCHKKESKVPGKIRTYSDEGAGNSSICQRQSKQEQGFFSGFWEYDPLPFNSEF